MSTQYITPYLIRTTLGRVNSSWYDIEGRELRYTQKSAREIMKLLEQASSILNGIIAMEDAGIWEGEEREIEEEELRPDEV